MNRKFALVFIALFSLTLIFTGPPAFSENTMLLGLCQELVNQARSYEARATGHSRTAKNIMVQIENTAQWPKNQGTSDALDNLFSQYDQHRAMELKYRDLYQRAADEAKKCMKSVQ